MNVRGIRRPSPAFVVAMIALFIALGGTAGAVVNAAVPLAKRALVADNAKKLGGQTAAQISAKATAAALSQSPAGRGLRAQRQRSSRARACRSAQARRPSKS